MSITRQEHRALLLPGAQCRAWGWEGPKQPLDVVLRDVWWGTDGHIWCFDSFLQEDYIPYPSIDEVGALNHPERLLAIAFPKPLKTGELVESRFQGELHKAGSSSPSLQLLLFLSGTFPFLAERELLSERGWICLGARAGSCCGGDRM